MTKKAKYGYSVEGKPLETQNEVILDYLLHHPGKANAISHKQCESMFGFTRLGARVWDISHDYGVEINREDRKAITRWPNVHSDPTYYWIEPHDAARLLNEMTTIFKA